MADNNQENKDFIQKTTDKLNDLSKQQKKAKRSLKILSFVMAHIVSILAILGTIIAAVILVCAISYFLNGNTFKNWINSFIGDGNNSTSIKTTINADGNKYSYKVDFTANIPDTIDKTLNNDEIFIEILKSNGLSEDKITEKTVKACKDFYKVSIATKSLDLRSIKEMYNGEEINKLEIQDFEDDTIQGTIRLQRKSTDGTIYYMEYIPYEEFQEYMKNEATESEYNYIKNKFSIDEEENITIAKWSYTKIDYNYKKESDSGFDNVEKEQLPQELQRWEDKDSYSITEEKIDYKAKVSKYSMPFEFLAALLVTTNNVDFCVDVANLALDSNILITVLENYNESKSDGYKMNYKYHTKEIKEVDYVVKAETTVLESEKDYKILKEKDDEGNDVTTYNVEHYEIEAFEQYITNTYTIEISEVNNWMLEYKKTYPTYQEKIVETDLSSENLGTYEDVSQPGPFNADEDEHAKELKEELLEENKIIPDTPPTINVTTNTTQVTNTTNTSNTTTDTSNTTETITTYNINIYSNNGRMSTILCDGITNTVNATSSQLTYSQLPSAITVISEALTVTGEQVIFTFFNSGYGYYCEYNNSDIELTCDITNLTVESYQKKDGQTLGNRITTSYESNEEPNSTTKIKVKDEEGNWEGFLSIYSRNKYQSGKALMENIEFWFYEYLEKSQNTIELVDYMKLLIYAYENPDSDLSEFEEYINSLIQMYEPSTFSNSASGQFNQLYDLIYYWEETGPTEGDYYIVYADSYGVLTVGHGVNIPANMGTYPELAQYNYEGAKAPKEEIDKISEELVKNYYERAKDISKGVNLEDYQIMALAVHLYQAGPYSITQTEFTTAYNKYWKEEYNEQYFGNYNGSESFDNGLCLAVSDGGVFGVGVHDLEGVNNRRRSEFLLFKYGYFTNTGEYYRKESGNDIQQAVVEVAKNSSSYGIVPEYGYCQAWVSEVYEVSGANSSWAGACCARCAGSKWGASTNWNEIQLGAAVYGYCYGSTGYGHVGIYIGDGMVAHNIGYVEIEDLDSWVDTYDGACWGWNGGTDLSGGSYPSVAGLMSGCSF